MTLEHVDVLIVGAGLSGVGAGCHLETQCPGKTYAILEARDSIGGTWDLFRYPGIRSDSDMYTLGYSFRPWLEAKAIADGPAILNYVKQTASDYRVDEKIRFNHRVIRAEWSTAESRWTVEAERTDTGETVRHTCGFLFMCSGYYRYDEAYTPELPGRERFAGPIVHPQFWTDDVDYAGKRVVVIGSGATAVTLVPAMAETADARDDAPALAQLRRLAAGGGPDREPRAPRAAGEARLCSRPLEERDDAVAGLPAEPAQAALHEGAHPQGARDPPAVRL